MLRWNSRPLIGRKLSQDFYQPMRMLKFKGRVNIRWKFLYRIWSRLGRTALHCYSVIIVGMGRITLFNWEEIVMGRGGPHRGSCSSTETAVPGLIPVVDWNFSFGLHTDFPLHIQWHVFWTSGTFFCTACQYHTKPLLSFFLFNSYAKLCRVNKRSVISLSVHYQCLCRNPAIEMKQVLLFSNGGRKNSCGRGRIKKARVTPWAYQQVDFVCSGPFWTSWHC